MLAGAPARVLLATPAWRGTDRLADLLRAWAVAFPANAPVALYLLADPDVDGGPERWESHVLKAAGEAGVDLGACADVAVLDHALHGRDAERIHRAVHGYVPLHDACGGHLRMARALDVRDRRAERRLAHRLGRRAHTLTRRDGSRARFP